MSAANDPSTPEFDTGFNGDIAARTDVARAFLRQNPADPIPRRIAELRADAIRNEIGIAQIVRAPEQPRARHDIERIHQERRVHGVLNVNNNDELRLRINPDEGGLPINLQDGFADLEPEVQPEEGDRFDYIDDQIYLLNVVPAEQNRRRHAEQYGRWLSNHARIINSNPQDGDDGDVILRGGGGYARRRVDQFWGAGSHGGGLTDWDDWLRTDPDQAYLYDLLPYSDRSTERTTQGS
eukprot:g17773.t1